MLGHMRTMVARHERGLSAAAFVIGFFWDNLTLSQIDRLYDNLVLVFYLVVAFAAMVLLNAHAARGSTRRVARRRVGRPEIPLPLAVGVRALAAPKEVEKSVALLRGVVASIFVLFTVLYFNNMIPPIPLSLKSIGVYHSLLREQSGAYRATFESAPWYALHRSTASVFHIV